MTRYTNRSMVARWAALSALKKKFSKPPTHAIPSPEELVCMFFKWAAPLENSNSYAILPFINGVTQPLTRILRRHEIQVINKPLKTLQQEFPSPKFRPSTEHQPNLVYKIPCANCGWCYIGETGRCFETRKKEHIRNVKTCANGSNIVKHAWSFDHRIDFQLTILASLTKALFGLEKLWKLGTPLLLSMLTITPSRFQTSIVFFFKK